jgi:hypothetical protein
MVRQDRAVSAAIRIGWVASSEGSDRSQMAGPDAPDEVTCRQLCPGIAAMQRRLGCPVCWICCVLRAGPCRVVVRREGPGPLAIEQPADGDNPRSTLCSRPRSNASASARWTGPTNSGSRSADATRCSAATRALRSFSRAAAALSAARSSIASVLRTASRASLASLSARRVSAFAAVTSALAFANAAGTGLRAG